MSLSHCRVVIDVVLRVFVVLTFPVLVLTIAVFVVFAVLDCSIVIWLGHRVRSVVPDMPFCCHSRRYGI